LPAANTNIEGDFVIRTDPVENRKKSLELPLRTRTRVPVAEDAPPFSAVFGKKDSDVFGVWKRENYPMFVCDMKSLNVGRQITSWVGLASFICDGFFICFFFKNSLGDFLVKSLVCSQ
jgi:hypothetical protein